MSTGAKPNNDKKNATETHEATRILTVSVYLIWNYLLHLSYWKFEDSWLHYYVANGLYIRLYGIHMLHLFTVIIYVIACFKSPGFIEIAPQQHSTEIHSPKYCAVCRIIKPPRSKHCYQCGKCIVRYDHHCLFTSNCVGANNHAFFVFYLFIQLLFLSWSAPLSITCIQFGYVHLGRVGYVQFFYRCMCCVGISFAFIALSLLFLFHVYLIVSNQTTLVFFKRTGICQSKKRMHDKEKSTYDAKHFEPAETNQSILLNVIHFFTNPIPNEWKIAKIHDDITPKSDWLSNEAVAKQNYLDTAGIGCVPLPSFKQD